MKTERGDGRSEIEEAGLAAVGGALCPDTIISPAERVFDRGIKPLLQCRRGM
jgi:hypothetical protein